VSGLLKIILVFLTRNSDETKAKFSCFPFVTKIYFYAFHVFFQDINDCESAPCANGGLCTDMVNDYTCACIAGYTGKACNASEYIVFIFNIKEVFYFNLNKTLID